MNVLAFFAHPDDETILAGGTLALISELGHSVHILTATRGEGGEIGEPPLGLREELGLIRERELHKAVEILGVSSLTFLNYVDPIVGDDNKLFAFSNDVERLISELAAVVLRLDIDIIITHGSNGEYGHPAHKFVHDSVQSYANKSDNLTAWYTCQAFYAESPKPHLANKDDPADWVVDIKTVINKKINAARAHESQIPLFLRRKQVELQREILLDEVIADEESFRFAGGLKDLLFILFNANGMIKDAF